MKIRTRIISIIIYLLLRNTHFCGAIENLNIDPQTPLYPESKMTITCDVAQPGNVVEFEITQPQRFIIYPERVQDNGDGDLDAIEGKITTEIIIPPNITPDSYTIKFTGQDQSIMTHTFTVSPDRSHFLHQVKDFIMLSGRKDFVKYVPESFGNTRNIEQTLDFAQGNIWILDLTSQRNRFRVITNEGYSCFPTWSPDSKKIAYLFTRDDRKTIRIIESDHFNEEFFGQTIPIPVEMPFEEIRNLVWSPDGSKIAFLGGKTTQDCDIWMLTFPDNILEQVTHQASVSEILKWSLDGTEICFTSQQTIQTTFPILIEKSLLKMAEMGLLPENAPPKDIFAIHINTKKTRKFEYDGAWKVLQHLSPDTMKIVFQLTSRVTNQSDIWIMDRDGKNSEPLTDDEYWELYLSWSPDGNEIVFVSNRPIRNR